MLDFFKKDKEPRDIEEILSRFKELKKDIKQISERLKSLEEKNKESIQGIGVVRFNPFKDTGGNQSFSVAFLDKNKDGVVITSLYGREGNRVFAKLVKRGKSGYLLTEEEKKAIEKANQKDDK